MYAMKCILLDPEAFNVNTNTNSVVVENETLARVRKMTKVPEIK